MGNTVTLSDVNSTCWYVIQTKPQQEARAESNLKTLPVETFLPKIPAAPG